MWGAWGCDARKKEDLQSHKDRALDCARIEATESMLCRKNEGSLGENAWKGMVDTLCRAGLGTGGFRVGKDARREGCGCARKLGAQMKGKGSASEAGKRRGWLLEGALVGCLKLCQTEKKRTCKATRKERWIARALRQVGRLCYAEKKQGSLGESAWKGMVDTPCRAGLGTGGFRAGKSRRRAGLPTFAEVGGAGGGRRGCAGSERLPQEIRTVFEKRWRRGGNLI